MKKHFLYRKKVERYLDEKDFDSPILKENGITGGDTFAVETNGESSGHEAFHAFDGDKTTTWYATQKPADFIFYNPNPLKVTKLEMYIYYAGYNPVGFTLYGSDDKNHWEILDFNFTDDGQRTYTFDLSTNNKFYHYKLNNIHYFCV